MTDTLANAAARFASDTGDHAMTVLHDDGIYRHLRFRAPNTGMYWFEIVTWPGTLAIRGDFGDSYMFVRLDDMFEFFRSQRGYIDRINPMYWAEKVVDGRDRCEKYSPDMFRAMVDDKVQQHEGDYPGLSKAVEYALSNDYNHEYEEGAREFLRDFTYRDESGATFEFHDTWEWDLSDWSWQYLWACHALAWGISQYDKAKAETAVAA